MVFNNYKGQNEATALLLSPIGASSTSVVLEAGKGGLFGSEFPELAKIEKFDTIGRVTKREIVKITNRVGDTLTIVRSAGLCPSDYTAITQTNTAFSFDAGDTISIVVTAEAFDDLQDEVVRLESAKLDKTTYNAEKISYSASSGGTDDYVVTIPDTSLIDGRTYKIKADVGNTGTATLNVNGLGAKTLKKLKTSAFADLETGDIIANQIFFATYNSSSGGFFQFSVDPAQVIIPDVASTKSTFVAGENITAGNALYVSVGASDGSRTAGIVYRTDASDTLRLSFIGFATNTATTGNNVIVDTSGVSATQSGLTIGSDYYLSGGNTLTSQLLTNNTTEIGYSTTTYLYKQGQTFQLSTPTQGIKVILKLRKIGSPTDDLFVKIYSSNKTTLLGTSNLISGTTLTASGVDYTFNISGLNLLASTEYFLSIERNGTLSTSNYYLIDRYTIASDTAYTNGQMFTYNNGTLTWDSYVSGGDFTDLYFNILQGGDGLISTTPGTNSKKCGKAISTTGILVNTFA